MKHDFLRRLGALALAFALTLSLAPTAWAAGRIDGMGMDDTNISMPILSIKGPGDLKIFKLDEFGAKEYITTGDEYRLENDPQNPGVVTLLSDGRFRADKAGTATITVTLGTSSGGVFIPEKDPQGNDIRTTFTVNVSDGSTKPDERTITLYPGPDTPLNQSGDGILLAEGGAKRATLIAQTTGPNADDLAVTWSWSPTGQQVASHEVVPNSNNRTVSISPGQRGSATITASLHDETGKVIATDTFNVYVSSLKMEIKDDQNALINGRTLTLEQGKTLTVSAAVIDGEKVYRDGINYTSSAGTIVNVATGTGGTATLRASAAKSGTVTITVESQQGVTDTFYVVVPEPGTVPVQSVTLDRKELRLGLNESFDLIATVLPYNAKDKTVTWSTSDASVASVNDKGRVTANKVGTAVITVTSNADYTKYAECTVTVAPGLTSLRIKDANANDQLILKDGMTRPGSTQSIEAIALPNNAYFNNVTWSSNTPSVITVQKDSRYESGLIATLTSVGPGEAKITVKSGDVEGFCNVVIPGIILKCDTVTITGGKMTLKEGQTVPLAYDSFGQAKTETGTRSPEWISSNSAVVEVDRLTGMITARSKGTATIELMLGNYSAKCEVTVVEDTEGIITLTGNYPAGSPVNMNTARGTSDAGSGTLPTIFNALSRLKTGNSALYITSLSVASTEQGILHDEHHSADDTGAGVGLLDRYYLNANTAQGQRPLSDLSFVPRTTFSGMAEITFTGWSSNNQPFNGTIRINVNGTGDVMYASNEGAPVTFLADDFNFYHPNLKSVSFTPPQESVGTLYYNYTSASQPGTKVTSSTAYGRTSTPSLNRITFVPAVGYQGTARIAYKGTDTSGRSFTGTVTITVTRASGSSADPADISYSVRENSWVTFRPSDFGNASRYTLGETLSYVRFTPPPSSEGTLFYNYRGFSDFDSMVNNTTSYYYGGNPALGGVSFVPTTTTPGQVDIGYTGYTSLGNTFEGTIHITIGDATEGGQQQLPLHYTVFTGRTVNLSASDFNTACRNATGYDLASVQFTRLPGVSQGTLRYTRGSSSTANNVTTSIRFYRTGTGSSANLIGNVYFQAGNNTGTVTIPFTGTDERGTTFTDEVTIVVTPPTASEITYSGTTASPIRLSSSRISSALSGAWNQSLSYITFTSLPSTTAGRLYLGYSGVGTGTQVNTGTRYYVSAYPSIDQISFVPRGRYNGQVSVGYTAASANGQSVSGRILFNISSTGSSSYFNDMAYHTWAAPSVDYLYQNQVTNGVTATQYGPNQRINRCDFVLMLCRAFKFSGSNGYSFADVPTNSYFSQAVATAKQLGIVSGDGNNFRPYGQVTRQDAMVMIYNALRAAGWNVGNASTSVLNQFSDSASVSSYARTAVSALVQMGAVNGDNGRLLPHNSITRAEAAVILHFVMTM